MEQICNNHLGYINQGIVKELFQGFLVNTAATQLLTFLPLPQTDIAPEDWSSQKEG